MSKFIISMPEGWDWAMCYKCGEVAQGYYQQNACGLKNCPLAKAREVVEVNANAMQHYGETENGKIHDKDGKPVKLWASKEEKI